MTNIYRRIYEKQYGPIPKDEFGRTYEIHHIDGNHENNIIDNLLCISIQEHFDIHYAQEDWAACHAILLRIKMSPEEISKNMSDLQKRRVESGTHNLLGGEAQRKRVKDGLHHFLGGQIGGYFSRERVKNGTHNLLGDNCPVHKRVESGEQSRMMIEENKKRIKNGTHNLLGNNPNRPKQKLHTCPHCGKTGIGGGMKLWHFDNCRSKD